MSKIISVDGGVIETFGYSFSKQKESISSVGRVYIGKGAYKASPNSCKYNKAYLMSVEICIEGKHYSTCYNIIGKNIKDFPNITGNAGVLRAIQFVLARLDGEEITKLIGYIFQVGFRAGQQDLQKNLRTLLDIDRSIAEW